MIKEFPFLDIVSDVSGGNLKIQKSAYAESGSIQIIDQGKNLIAGYTDDKSYLFKSAPLPVVIFGDHTCCIKHAEQPFAMGADGVKILKPREDCDSKYLYHFLQQVRLTDGGYDRHFKYLKRIQIPLPMKNGKPDLLEQQRIAGILDQADAIRRKRQQALQLTDELLRATFLDLFGDPVTNPKGWGMKEVQEIGQVQGGLQVSHARSKHPIEKPYLRVANVFRDKLKLDEVKSIRVTQAELDRVRLEAGDVLIVEGHGNPNELGRAAIWHGAISDCLHQNHLIRVRFNTDKVLPAYASFYLNSDGGRAQMLRSGKTTSGLNTISSRNVKETQIPTPPLALQQKFQLIMKTLTVSVEKLEKHLEQSNDLFASLQQYAFKGEL